MRGVEIGDGEACSTLGVRLPANIWPVLQSGANAEALSHEDYLNAPGEKVSSKFTTPGKYSYCEPPFPQDDLTFERCMLMCLMFQSHIMQVGHLT